MGKSKQTKETTKKFDRNVEISAPILDPEIIKAIHSPPKGQRLDIKHGGFKALLSDLNSQDSTDELTPLNENHVPSYIGISCAVSGYSSYSSYNNTGNNISGNLGSRINDEDIRKSRLTTRQFGAKNSANNALSPLRSNTTSPVAIQHHPVRHIKVDKNNFPAGDEERKELTEKLTASAAEHQRRSPSPCIPPTEDDRHHGAYVGARYCPLPPPSKLVNKHIPLLGIDDDEDPDEHVEDDGVKKVEQKIASLYGEDFVDNWRESLSHKAKKEHENQDQGDSAATILKSPKDLVTLKPTPAPVNNKNEVSNDNTDSVVAPDVKVFAGVQKDFLNKLLTDENPPKPSPPSSPIGRLASSTATTTTTTTATVKSPVQSPVQPSTPVKSSKISEKSMSPPAMSPPTSPIQEIADDFVKKTPPTSPEHNISTSDATELQSSSKIVDDEKTPIESPSSQILNDHMEENLERENLMRNDSYPASPELGDVHEDKVELLDEHVERQYAEQATSQPQQDIIRSHVGENLIEYEIRTQSPVDNQSSPERIAQPVIAEQCSSDIDPMGAVIEAKIVESANELLDISIEPQKVENPVEENPLVSFSPEPRHEEEADERNIVNSNPISSLIDLEPSPEAVVQHEQANSNLGEAVIPEETSTTETSDVIDYVNPSVVTKIEPDDISHSDENQNEPETVQEKMKPIEEERVADEGAVVQDGRHYLNLLEQEKSFISSQVARAEKLLEERESDLDEDTIGKIRSAIGKANLLMNKKCNQFRELCEGNINSNADEQYAVLNDDLAGFWDMLCIQIVEVRDLFSKLSLN